MMGIYVRAIFGNLFLAVAAVAIYTWSSGGLAKFEGRYWPAASSLTVTNISEEDGAAIFDGYFYVLRPSHCNFSSFDWRKGTRSGRSIPIKIKFGKPQVRQGGYQKFYGWSLPDVSAENFYDTYADVLHDCGWPWLTRTPFWN